MKTLLRRTKGSALDVFVDSWVPNSILTPLSSHAKRFRRLCFSGRSFHDIQRFFKVNPGPLPLLHTLEISTDGRVGLRSGLRRFDVIIPPSTLLLNNMPNLKAFSFRWASNWLPSFGCFTFPNLTSFRMLVELGKSFSASQILDFLEASPMLRTVHMEIFADISLEGVPQDRLVVLRSVDNFDFTMIDGGHIYEFIAHISCPSASSASLTATKKPNHVRSEEIFPSLDLWNTIVHQYTRRPVEEVTFQITHTPDIMCKLAFNSSDGSVLKLCFEVSGYWGEDGDEDDEDDDEGGDGDEDEDEDEDGDEDEEEDEDDSEDEYGDEDEFESKTKIYNKVFAQATRTIQDHPQVTDVKRLRTCHNFPAVHWHTVNKLCQLFESMGPLDELTLHCCHLPAYFDSIFKDGVKKKVVFPPIKQLTISHGECTYGMYIQIAELAKLRHGLGIPFERVIIYDESERLKGVEKRLRPWVGSVEYYRTGWTERYKSII